MSRAGPTAARAWMGGGNRHRGQRFWTGREPAPNLRGPLSLALAAKQTARSALLTANMATHRARMLPDFLIVGAARCGTTSLFSALSQHPAVFNGAMLPWTREVHYFDNHYDRGLAWYRSHFPLRARAGRIARAADAAAMAFESGPYYMFHPLAADRIRRDLPPVKLLVMVRDPVERARSGHSFSTSLGFETEPFERALELEAARLDGEAEQIMADPRYVSHSHRHHSYRARGEYIDQIERLERLFGRDRIHVIESDDFFSGPEPVYDAVLRFLGLPHRGYPGFERHNARPRTPVPQTVRRALEEHYRPYDERLARWLGHEPSWRRQAGRSRVGAE